MRNKITIQCCSVCFILILLMSNAHAVSVKSTKKEVDSDGDGTIDNITYSIYEDCYLVEERSDRDANDVFDAITYFEHNVGKYTQIARMDRDADGEIDGITYTQEIESGGEHRFILEEDSDGDGTIDSFTCQLTVEGQSSATVKIYKGTGSYNRSGTLERATYITKDANGNHIKEELDKDGDGSIDQVSFSKFDQDCLEVLREVDVDNDGDIDNTFENSYDHICSPTKIESDSATMLNGIAVRRVGLTRMDYTYDAYGYPTKIITDTNLKQTIRGETTVIADSTSITTMTNEYGNGDCGPYTLCPVCSGNQTDGDNDGLPDTLENSGCTDSQDADTDDDGIVDGKEDSNQNGIVDSGETNPCSIDSDGDGIQDGTESGVTLAMLGPDTDTTVFIPDADPRTTTNPLSTDTDGDGLSDGEEDTNSNGRVDPGESNPGRRDNDSSSVHLTGSNLLLLE